MQWSFGADEAARITQPALAVLGENSIPVFRERRDLLLAWLPSVEAYVLPGATHLLQVRAPGRSRTRLCSFFARQDHPSQLAGRQLDTATAATVRVGGSCLRPSRSPRRLPPRPRLKPTPSARRGRR